MDILCALLRGIKRRQNRLEHQLQDLIASCSKLREMVEDVRAEQSRVWSMLSRAYGDTLCCDKCGTLLVRPQNYGKPGVVAQCPVCYHLLYGRKDEED